MSGRFQGKKPQTKKENKKPDVIVKFGVGKSLRKWLFLISKFHRMYASLNIFYPVSIHKKMCIHNHLLQYNIKNAWSLLIGVVQLVEHRATQKKVAGLIPRQGTCLGWGPGTLLGNLREAIGWCSLAHQFSSSFPSLPLSLKLNKQNILKKHNLEEKFQVIFEI